MSGNRNECGDAGRNVNERPDQQQYDPFGNPLPNAATYPTSSFPYSLRQSPMPGYVVPQPPDMLMGGFPQQAPYTYGFNPSQQVGGRQNHSPHGMPPLHGFHESLPQNQSISMAMNSPWPSMHGSMSVQQPPYHSMQNSLQPFAGVPPPSLPHQAFPQATSMLTSASHQSFPFDNSAFDMQQAVLAPPFVPNLPALPDPAAEFDDDYIHPRTGRPSRPFLPHEKVLLRQYYRLKHPLAPNATDRHIQMWHIGLRSTELTEWDKFVADNESNSEAGERVEAISDYLEWIKNMTQNARDEIRSEARGNVHGRPGRKPGSRNKPKTGPLAQGAGVKKAYPRNGGSFLKGKKSTTKLDSDDEEEEDDDTGDNDEGETIVVEGRKTGMSKGKGRVATQKNSATRTKHSSKQAAAEASEEDADDEEELVEENYEEISGQEDMEDADGSGTDMEFTEDN